MTRVARVTNDFLQLMTTHKWYLLTDNTESSRAVGFPLRGERAGFLTTISVLFFLISVALSTGRRKEEDAYYLLVISWGAFSARAHTWKPCPSVRLGSPTQTRASPVWYLNGSRQSADTASAELCLWGADRDPDLHMTADCESCRIKTCILWQIDLDMRILLAIMLWI